MERRKVALMFAACRKHTNPKISGAIVFHVQGPRLFDYSIRLNHTWAFSGFPDLKSIMDTNGPYLNDLELGVNIIPIMQYSFSGFLTVWSHHPSIAFENSICFWRLTMCITIYMGQTLLLISNSRLNLVWKYVAMFLYHFQ